MFAIVKSSTVTSLAAIVAVALPAVPYSLPAGLVIQAALPDAMITSSALPAAPSRVRSGLLAGTLMTSL
ncbi:MAG TPA: hypothetical protein VIP48_02755 [Streptosporangiaceae bacterium]